MAAQLYELSVTGPFRPQEVSLGLIKLDLYKKGQYLISFDVYMTLDHKVCVCVWKQLQPAAVCASSCTALLNSIFIQGRLTDKLCEVLDKSMPL